MLQRIVYSISIVVIIITFSLWFWLTFKMYTSPKPTNIITLDSRVTELEAKVETLELWAVRHGAKYKGDKQ